MPQTQTTLLPPEERIGYAILGLGELTLEELLPALRSATHSRIRAFVSDDKEKAVAQALAHGLTADDAYLYDEFEQLEARGDVQAVFIVLPNNLHRDYTERAAQMGKHVLCEKPMATSVEDAEAMVRACEAAKVKLMIAYRCQYTPTHWAARDLIDRGELGQIKLMQSINGQTQDDANVWRLKLEQAGGGPWPDVGLYCLNTLRFLTGQEPYEVFAYLYKPEQDERFAEVEEAVSWLMRFPGGLEATCMTSYSTLITRQIYVLGEKAALELNPAFTYENLELTVKRERGVEQLTVPQPDQFALELDHFSQCILEDKTPFTPGEEGLQDQRIMAAIYQSARQGRPVQLERIEKKDAFRGSRPQGH